MTNNRKKLVIGIAAGAAVLAGAALIVAKKRKDTKYRARVQEAKENFKHKLDQLQRKAEKEFKNAKGGAEDVVNAAAKRAQDWAGKASQA